MQTKISSFFLPISSNPPSASASTSTQAGTTHTDINNSESYHAILPDNDDRNRHRSRSRGSGRIHGSRRKITPKRTARAEIATENLTIYGPDLVNSDDLEAAVCYLSCPSLEPNTAVSGWKTTYWLFNLDSFDCAELVRKKWGYKADEVAVLNMANANHPGGGYLSGAMAQEEALCRRSTLYSHLSYRESTFSNISSPRPHETDPSVNYNKLWYRFEPAGGLWTPGVLVFRKGDDQDCELMQAKDRFKVGVISVAAINRPDLTEDGKDYANPKEEVLTRKKIETILGIAQRHQQKVVILGAFGCGAFCNPPRKMADLFLDVLLSERFKGSFDRIVLAILERSGSQNLRPWQDSWKHILELNEG